MKAVGAVAVAVLMVVGLGACSDSGDTSDAAQAAKRQMQFVVDRQFDRQYDELHPAQQKLLTKAAYVSCANSEFGALPGGTKVSAKSSKKAQTDIPQTDLKGQENTTVELQLDSGGGGSDSKVTIDFPEFLVDGQYKWMLFAETLQHCLDKKNGTTSNSASSGG